MARPADSPSAFAARWLRRWKVPGASVAVVRRGRPPAFHAYGYRDRERKLPATPRTVYGLASVTKSFTALAILRLEEDGRLSVHDPVVKHLPSFRTPEPRATRRIELHHFLTHSSGIPPLPSIYYTTIRSLHDDPPFDPRVARRVGIDPDHAPIDTYEAILDYLARTPYRLLGRPGEVFSYSNEGFGLLGAVVESVAGQSYESYVEEAILRPAGMRSTTFDSGILFRYPEVTVLYSPKRTGRRHPFVPSETWWDDTCLRAAGGLRSNVEDLARYLEIFLGEGTVDGQRIVGRAAVRKMTQPYVPTLPGFAYGYGVEVAPEFPGGPLVFHSGGLPGVSSFFVAAPRPGVGSVVLTNAEGVSAPRVAMAEVNRQLARPLGAPLREPLKPIPPERSLAEFAGWYCSGEGIWVEVRPRRDHLRLDFRGIEVTDRNLRLRPAGSDRFVLNFGGAQGQLRFRRDSNGRPDAVFVGFRWLRRRTASERARAARGTAVW